MKRTAFWALPLAATLALTGCSGLFGTESSPSPTEASVEQSAPAPTPTESESASAQAPAPTESEADGESGFGDSSDGADGQAAFEAKATPAKQLTAAQLYSVGQALEATDPRPGTQILKDAELKDGASQLEGMMGDMEVSPEKCAVFNTGSVSEQLSHANQVAVAVPGDASAQTTTIAISSFDDSALVGDLLAKTKAASADCSEYTVKMQGQNVEASLKDGKATTDATETLANLSTVKVAGQTVKTVIVTAYDGNNVVAVTVTGPTDADISVIQAQDTIDEALLHMSGQ